MIIFEQNHFITLADLPKLILFWLESSGLSEKRQTSALWNNALM
jgi:hypothetical protein